jgi:hypothetical protein
MSTTAAQYSYSEAFDKFSEPDWESWFAADADDKEEEFVYTGTIAEEMLEQGQTLWNHPGWIKDVAQILRDWAQDDRLIRVRLFSEWLISTLPVHFLDAEFAEFLSHLAQGQFCEAFPGLTTPIHKEREFYIQSQNLNVLSELSNRDAEIRATVNTKFVSHYGKRLV